jgi:arylsulfatase A
MPIDRRSFMKTLSAACVVPLSTEAKASQPETAVVTGQRRRRAHSPNVIVMICDDLGYGDLGCYGSHLPTPNLDRMALESTRFTHFNAAHPICSASRSALLTGRYAQRTHTQGAYFPHSKTGMSLDEVTLANAFKGAKYTTKCIGKWHLGDAPEYLPTNRGFDSYFGVPYSVDMQSLPLLRDLTALEPETDRDELTKRYTEEAVHFLDNAGEGPFFLYLAYSYPHDPARASKEFQGKSRFGDVGDAVMEIDWSVGEVMKTLRQRGLDSDTVVFFTSDHGPWFQGSPGGLRGRKASTFEGGFRVPMLARWPGQIPANRVVGDWGSNLDLFPTLAGLCGLKLPEHPLDGADISHVLFKTGNEEATRKPILYFSPMSAQGSDLHCVREGDWKLRVAQGGGNVYINDSGSRSESAWLPRPELYNLAIDPGESYDVAKQYPERVQQMLADIEALMPTFPPDIIAAYTALKRNVASRTTPPGAAFRQKTNAPLPEWAWEPQDRR